MEKVKIARQCNFVNFTDVIDDNNDLEIPTLYLRYDRIISVYEVKKHKPDFDKTIYYWYFVETEDKGRYRISYNDYCKFKKYFNPEF